MSYFFLFYFDAALYFIHVIRDFSEILSCHKIWSFFILFPCSYYLLILIRDRTVSTIFETTKFLSDFKPVIGVSILHGIGGFLMLLADLIL